MASSARQPSDRGNVSDYSAEHFESPGRPYYRVGMERRLLNYPQNAAIHGM